MTNTQPRLLDIVQRALHRAGYCSHDSVFNIQDGMLTPRGQRDLEWYLLSPAASWWHGQKKVLYAIVGIRREITVLSVNRCAALNVSLHQYTCLFVKLE